MPRNLNQPIRKRSQINVNLPNHKKRQHLHGGQSKRCNFLQRQIKDRSNQNPAHDETPGCNPNAKPRPYILPYIARMHDTNRDGILTMASIKLPHPFPASWEGKPPGMSLNDRFLWSPWKKINALQSDIFYYNVRLTEPHPRADQLTEQEKHICEKIGARRIDVVMLRQNKATIIEIRWDANENIVARLQLYKALWLSSPTVIGPPELLLITNKIRPDTKRLADAQGIRYDIVRL